MEIKKEIEKKSYAVKFIAEIDGKQIGRAYLYLIYNDLHENSYGLMEDVFVEEPYRGKGIGTALVSAVIAEAKERGCYKLIGQSRYGREKVHELYQKLGFGDHGKNFRIDFEGKD